MSVDEKLNSARRQTLKNIQNKFLGVFLTTMRKIVVEGEPKQKL